MKGPVTKRLKLEYDELLSRFAFNFNLRRYTVDTSQQVSDSLMPGILKERVERGAVRTVEEEEPPDPKPQKTTITPVPVGADTHNATSSQRHVIHHVSDGSHFS